MVHYMGLAMSLNCVNYISTLEYYKQHTVFEGDEDCNLY